MYNLLSWLKKQDAVLLSAFFLGFLSFSALFWLLAFTYVIHGFSLTVLYGTIVFSCSLFSGFRSLHDFFSGQFSISNRDVIAWLVLLIKITCITLMVREQHSNFLTILIIVSVVFFVRDFKLEFLPKVIKYLFMMLIATIITLFSGLHHWYEMVILLFAIIGSLIMEDITYWMYIELNSQTRSLAILNRKVAEISAYNERVRIEHELHDKVGHELTALNIHLQLMAQVSTPSHATIEAIRSRVLLINQLLRDVISNQDFHQKLSLQEVIKLLVERLPRITCYLDLPEESIYVAEKQQRIFTQGLLECLTNCLKHSEAEEVRVQMSIVEKRHIVVAITNSVSFIDTPSKDVSSFLGLQILKNNMLSCGGDLHIQLCDGCFEVRISFPLNSEVA